MRHRLFGKKLGRNHNQRQALFRSLLKSIFKYSAIETTQAKAKAVLPLVEKFCQAAKKGDLVSRRYLFRYFQDQTVVNKIVTAAQAAFSDIQGNFTRVVPVKIRQGDGSVVVKLSLVKKLDFPLKEKKVKEVKVALKKEEKKIKVIKPKKEVKK